MLMKDQPEDDPYYAAGIFCMNGLFEKGIAKFENNKITINNAEAYYAATKTMAMEIIGLYQDETMTERKAGAWVKEKCAPSDELEKVIAFVKTLPY
jgi:hypothetical protein